MAQAKELARCNECGQESRRLRKQLCGACYTRQRRRNAVIDICKNCAYEKRIEHSGLCKACATYQHRYGEPRPLRLIHREDKSKQVTDNIPGEERICLATGCPNPALEKAPWGFGFCADCMPRIERLLYSHYDNKNRAKGLAA